MQIRPSRHARGWAVGPGCIPVGDDGTIVDPTGGVLELLVSEELDEHPATTAAAARAATAAAIRADVTR